MLQNIGISEFVLIAVAALVLFGPDKLPGIGRKLGQAVRQFRSGAAALIEEVTRSPEQRRPAQPEADQPAQAGQQQQPASSAAAAPATSVPAASPASPSAAHGGTAAAAVHDQAGAAANSSVPHTVKPRRAPDPRRLPE